MFESVRQIIESRIFSVTYTSVAGDTFSSIAAEFNQSVEKVTGLNLNANVTTGTEILFSVNTDNRFSNSRISGFTTGHLSNNVGILFFGGFGNTSLAGTANITGSQVQLYATEAATAGSLEDKVVNWTDIINGESSLGFTATVTSNGLGITLMPKSGISDILVGSLTVTANNPFNLSLAEVQTVQVGTILSLGSTLPFPTFLESREFVQPTTGGMNWAVLFINDSAVVGREFGNTSKGLRSSGSVRLKLYAPRSAGTRLIRSMADEFNAILSYTAGDTNTGAGGTLFMKAGSLTKVSDDDDGKISYNLDYIYDYYTS